MNSWSMRGGVRGCRTLQGGGGVRDARRRDVEIRHHRLRAVAYDGFNKVLLLDGGGYTWRTGRDSSDCVIQFTERK